MLYRKRPMVVEAEKWMGDWYESGADKAPEWVKKALASGTLVFDGQGDLFVDTLEGRMLVNIGDYIVKGVMGELYPCKPDVFNAT